MKLLFALLSLLPLMALADRIDWASQRGLWDKPGFDSSSIEKSVVSHSGSNRLTVQLSHRASSGFSYSKWEVERWGDPSGVWAPPGSWQVTNNEANDVVLGFWGYWGWDGANASPKTKPDDTTNYLVTLRFEQPVRDLRLPVHGINALLKDGFNSIDHLEAKAFRQGTALAAPTVVTLGTSLAASPAALDGKWTAPVNEPTSDEASAQWIFAGPLDAVELRFTCRAAHPTPSLFSNGQQFWSFSLGELSFENEISDSQPSNLGFAERRRQLEKVGFDSSTASLNATSTDGALPVRFELEHLGTTAGYGSYSKWEIDRWGDPNGQMFASGSWQVVSNATNDVVLACWGYWGWPLAEGGPKLHIGDSTSYRLRLKFAQAVSDLSFQINGINGFIKPSAGYNSGDRLTVTSSLLGVPRADPVFSEQGPSFTRVGAALTGDFNRQIDGGISGQHVSNDGSVRVTFPGLVDQVELNLVNTANHYDATQFKDGTQTWSFSIGQLNFRHGAGPAASLINRALSPAASARQSSTLGSYAKAELAKDGNRNGNFWARGIAHTQYESTPWWEIDLGSNVDLRFIRLWRRTDAVASPVTDLKVFASKEPFGTKSLAEISAMPSVSQMAISNFEGPSLLLSFDRSARYIRVQRAGQGFLCLSEVELLSEANADPMPGVTYRAFEQVSAGWPNFESMRQMASGVTTRFGLPIKPRADFVGMEYRGLIRVSASGTHGFYVNLPNSQLLLDSTSLWQPNPSATGERTASVNLTAGWHPFILRTYERTGASPLRVSWSGPGFSKQEVPPNALAVADTMALTSVEQPLPSGDEDADQWSNFLEFALGRNPSRPDLASPGHRLEIASGHVESVYSRPSGMARLLSYSLEVSTDLKTWVIAPEGSISDLGNGMEQVRQSNLDNLIPASADGGFVRLRIRSDADAWLGQGPVLAWRKTSLRAGFQTHALCLPRPAIFAGTVAELGESALLCTEPGCAVLASGAPACYLELISGNYEGHRFEIDWTTSRDHVIALQLGSPLTTLRVLPANDLLGSRFVIRPHWTLGLAYDKALFQSSPDPSFSDQLLTFAASQYRGLSPVSLGNTRRWTDLADSSLADMEGMILPPGTGCFLKLGSATSQPLLYWGQMRENAFIQPLQVGFNFLSEPHPFPSSPLGRGLNSQAFLGSNDPSRADQIHQWGGDLRPGGSTFQGCFLLDLGTPGSRYWTGLSDSSLHDESATQLFLPDRAFFLRMTETGQPYYRVPRMTIP